MEFEESEKDFIYRTLGYFITEHTSRKTKAETFEVNVAGLVITLRYDFYAELEFITAEWKLLWRRVSLTYEGDKNALIRGLIYVKLATT